MPPFFPFQRSFFTGGPSSKVVPQLAQVPVTNNCYTSWVYIPYQWAGIIQNDALERMPEMFVECEMLLSPFRNQMMSKRRRRIVRKNKIKTSNFKTVVLYFPHSCSVKDKNKSLSLEVKSLRSDIFYSYSSFWVFTRHQRVELFCMR